MASSVSSIVIKEYLKGTSRDKIAQIAGLFSGTASNIIKEWTNKIDIPNVEEVRNFSILVKKAGLSIGQCAQGYRMFQLMRNLGINDDDIDNDENKIDDLEMAEDLHDNIKINYNEFSSFVNSIYLYCKNHGIEPNIVFSWITDLHEITSNPSTLPSFSNTINYPPNSNMEDHLPYSVQNQENQIISKDTPLISKVSFFIDQKKKECKSLENYRKNLEKEIKKLQTERNSLKNENDKLTEDNNKIIPYLDWYYTLKQELWERYSIDIDNDFEKFAKLINDLRNLGLDIPKIIEKYVAAISMEDKIQQETQHLETLQKENTQLYNSLLIWQDEINKHRLTLYFYHQLELMGFGLKEIKQLHNTILEITAANNISDDKAVLKFLKDVEEQYDNKLGFELKVDEKRNELDRLNNQIINFQYKLKITPFIGPVISSLFEKGVFEQDILAVNQLVDEYINDYSIYHDNKNNNNSIKKNVSKVEKLEQLIKDIRNYKNIKIEIK